MIKSYNREGRNIRAGLFFDRGNVTCEVSWLSRFAVGVKIDTAGESTLSGRLGLGLVQFYGATTLRRKDGRDRRLPRFRVDIDAYWLDHDLWLRVDLGEYDSMYARGRFHVITHTGRLKDRLLGKKQYAAREVKRARSVVPLPEGGMPCEIVWEEATWKRPRWPRTLTVLRADVTPDRPIGSPGKGENAWDCGDDATHSITGPVKGTTEREAVLMLSSSVLRDRERYGGSLSFTPAERAS